MGRRGRFSVPMPGGRGRRPARTACLGRLPRKHASRRTGMTKDRARHREVRARAKQAVRTACSRGIPRKHATHVTRPSKQERYHRRYLGKKGGFLLPSRTCADSLTADRIQRVGGDAVFDGLPITACTGGVHQ